MPRYSSSAWTSVYVSAQAATRTSSIDAVITADGWMKRESDLKALRRYRDDWDGMGASAPSPYLVDAAVRVLKEIQQRLGDQSPPPSAVSGTPMGRIMIEWRLGNNYLEVEVVDPHRVEWMEESDGKFKEWSETIYDWSEHDRSMGMLGADTVLGSESKGQMWSSSSISEQYIEDSPHVF
jgi:hypothetical protein